MRTTNTIIGALLVALLSGCSCDCEENKEGSSVTENPAVTSTTEDSAATSTTTQVVTTTTLSRETVRQWIEKFCSLEIEMSRDQIRAIMGEPTESVIRPDANFDTYEGWGVELNIGYDVNDLATFIWSFDETDVACDTKVRM